MAFTNCYEDAVRAEAYSQLEFANTYHLAFRDLPAILSEHVRGTKAVDFGCGAGRSTRFVRRLGFDTLGVDTAPEMIAKARQLDPGGDYRLTEQDDFSRLSQKAYDVVLSLFTFDNIAGWANKVQLLMKLAKLLRESGTLINVVSSPEIYVHEWASFSTRDYPENRFAKPGDVVKIITTDLADCRPALDILCPDVTYRELYAQARLDVVAMYKPLAKGDEPYRWVNETKIAHWVIYVLKLNGAELT